MRFSTLLQGTLPLLAFAADDNSDNTGYVRPAKPDGLPSIKPPIDYNGVIEQGLMDNLPPTPSQIKFLSRNKFPEDCMNHAKENNRGPDEFEVFEVYYEDCHAPWIMCRLKDTHVNATTMAEMFGRMPLGMREYIKHVILWKPKDLPGAAAWDAGDVIAISEDSFKLYVFAHELSHSLDAHVQIPGITPPGQGRLSQTRRWAEQFALDNATVSDYARTQWPENLAEVGIIALYNTVVPNGVANLRDNDPSEFYHQYATYETYYRDMITPKPNQSCTQRVPDSKMVYWPNITSDGFPVEGHTRKVGVTQIPPGSFHNETFIQPHSCR
ncbi:uncharacterized protein GGS22DRAFT_195054 [Annulohypoxylon maeteangense]|uniref:uncharacterized protein n=1 Tax=Annulohypoxylon maeteangense TaxID=1927788 RepID=UPI002007E331|nr:uncharacterized protein GGS22DRAFT_195054 [Annulohypoxylon maeteangense]KAI0883894.1 hypothetical protein GGS22DRAFT_195054 [Annulohypoxylon maeteangense]